jgi:hypothetical protein
MIAKLVCALALACLAAPANPETAIFVYYEPVKKVSCLEGTGTAFRIADGRFLSVNHVTRFTGCKIEGTAITVLHADAANDFSILAPIGKGAGFKVNCSGYAIGQPAYGVGHARGLPVQRLVTVRATGVRTSLNGGLPMAILWGDRFIPGMSGGPSLNHEGEVIGMVNGYATEEPISLSRALSDTAVCK